MSFTLFIFMRVHKHRLTIFGNPRKKKNDKKFNKIEKKLIKFTDDLEICFLYVKK